MKLNELMIGDWVYYTGDEKPLLCEIVALDKRDNMSAFEPIPLTEKILEKNGFIYSKPEFMTLSEEMVWRIEDRHEQAHVEIEEQTDDNGIDYYVGTFVSGTNRCEISFRFVHELQHALRVCGIDKEIVL